MSEISTVKMTMRDLREVALSGKYKIRVKSNDGLVPLRAFVDSGEKPSLRINGIGCATTHPFEVLQPDLTWKMVEAQFINYRSILRGPEDEHIPVTSIENIGLQNLFDLSIDHPNHRFLVSSSESQKPVSSSNCFN